MSIAGHLAEASAILSQVAIRPLPVLAAIAAMVILCLAGRIVLRQSEPAQAFGAGMGILVLAGTVLGTLGFDLRLVLGIVGALAAAAVMRDRGDIVSWLKPGLPLLLAGMPLLLLLSDRRGSEWDEFSHWLHAFRYLSDHYVLPGGPAAPAMVSCCAAYPYGWPLVGMLAMTLSGFSEAVPGLLNVLALGLFALLLVRLAQGEASRRISLPAAAAGLLFATLASPTFVNKLAFSAYADVATAFLAAVLAMTGERMVTETEPRRRMEYVLAFGLTGAALLGVKPGNAALFGCLLGGSIVLGLRHNGLQAILRPHLIAAVALPALGSLVWRWHVGKYLTGQEMVILPFEGWHIALIPKILLGMLDVAMNKGGHFGLGLVMVGLGIRGLWRNQGRFDRLCALAGMLFLGYNIFLLITYVVVFGDYEALHVASFWRYNTHLGLVIMLPAAIAAGRLIRAMSARTLRIVGAITAVLVVVGPLPAAEFIRFDFDRSKPFLRHSLREAIPLIPQGTRVAVIDANGTGLSGVMASYEWSGKLRVAAYHSAFNSEAPEDWLKPLNVEWAFVFSGHEKLGLGPTEAATVIRRHGTGWDIVGRFPFPGGKIPSRWP